MEHNTCGTCGANNGRCGMMITLTSLKIPECMNCHDTRKRGEVCIHLNLPRTEKELEKTMSILS